MTTYGKHTDFTGLVLVDIEGLFGANIPVRDARAEYCDMCDPGDPADDPDFDPPNCAADYTVAATAVLGPAGHDQHFCQKHMREYVRTSPDVWMVKA